MNSLATFAVAFILFVVGLSVIAHLWTELKIARAWVVVLEARIAWMHNEIGWQHETIRLLREEVTYLGGDPANCPPPVKDRSFVQ